MRGSVAVARCAQQRRGRHAEQLPHFTAPRPCHHPHPTAAAAEPRGWLATSPRRARAAKEALARVAKKRAQLAAERDAKQGERERAAENTNSITPELLKAHAYARKRFNYSLRPNSIAESASAPLLGSGASEPWWEQVEELALTDEKTLATVLLITPDFAQYSVDAYDACMMVRPNRPCIVVSSSTQ